MKCKRMLLIAMLLTLSSAMIGCASKIRVLLRDSVTREPIVGARVSADYMVKLTLRSHTWDDGITNKDGVVILYIVEEDLLNFMIYPYYNIESRDKSGRSWRMSFDHPARYGNTAWVQLERVFSDVDPEIEIKLEKYIESDDKAPGTKTLPSRKR